MTHYIQKPNGLSRNWNLQPCDDEVKVKVNVKCTLVQTLRLCTGRTAHRRSRGIALLFLDKALEGNEGSASRLDRFLSPGKIRYPLCRRLGGPQRRSGQLRKILSAPGFDPRTVQPVASRYTDWAILAPLQQWSVQLTLHCVLSFFPLTSWCYKLLTPTVLRHYFSDLLKYSPPLPNYIIGPRFRLDF